MSNYSTQSAKCLDCTQVEVLQKNDRFNRGNENKVVVLESQDLVVLEQAVEALNSPGLAIKITHAIGKPIENSLNMLPDKAVQRIGDVTSSALQYALQAAISSINDEAVIKPSNNMHKVLTMLSGAGGGAFGLPALIVELPVSTTLMLRSMVDIARSEGEDINTIESQLACIEVFALGGSSKADDGAEVGYYATRTALARSLSEAARFIAEKGLSDKGSPIILRLVTEIAARFSIPVSEKFIAQSVPIIGAVSGAAINYVFTSHFQQMAQGHFTVRRLERKYGADVIQSEYTRILNKN